jgi:hypothetical protein
MGSWWLGLLLVAGCSFSPGRLGGRTDAASEPSDSRNVDAALDATPTWQVVETLTVDGASSTPQYSQTVLAIGVVYHLRASGVLTNVIDPYAGDAEYFDFNAPKDLGCCEDIGLGIDDLVVDDLDTQPDWGSYTATHIYEVEWTGKGATISALYQDTYYANNVGTLTLEILELR